MTFSLGFSPSELIFCRNIRGPLKLFHENRVEEVETAEDSQVSGSLSSFEPDKLVCNTLTCDEVEEDELPKHDLGELKVDIKLNNSDVLSDPSKLCHLLQDQRSDVMCLLQEFQSIFGDVPQPSPVVTHSVVLVDDAAPVKQVPYLMSSQKIVILNDEVHFLIGNNLAEPSDNWIPGPTESNGPGESKRKRFLLFTKSEEQNESKRKRFLSPTKSEEHCDSKRKRFLSPTKSEGHCDSKRKSFLRSTTSEGQNESKRKRFLSPTKSEEQNESKRKRFLSPTKSEGHCDSKRKRFLRSTKSEGPDESKRKRFLSPTKLEGPDESKRNRFLSSTKSAGADE
ncbi:FMRF-amide neuropeptides-like 1 [Homarus americanus]|uniref:FMRF-amide neuropeptides-like 1 n=1 Tax=Homarus americanus TaxID=6706 RepID=A0A8J5N3G7_HOMAM|nr:FMRF-amide neuropeptides-like 1 [Homarus americanus]